MIINNKKNEKAADRRIRQPLLFVGMVLFSGEPFCYYSRISFIAFL